MKRLYLLRHAKSSWDDASLPDHARPLSKRGRKAATAIGRYMRAQGIAPDLVYVSSATRTLQTLERLGAFARAPAIETRLDLYLATPETIFRMIRQSPGPARSVLLIGHNPGLQELAALLCGADDGASPAIAARFPTGALAQFEMATPWAEAGPGAGRLTRFVTPHDLEA